MGVGEAAHHGRAHCGRVQALGGPGERGIKLQRAGLRRELVSRCKADPASAGPGSSNMEEQGERGGEEAEAIETPNQHDAYVVQIAKTMRGGEGGAVKRI